jgi:hypothetical protein
MSGAPTQNSNEARSMGTRISEPLPPPRSPGQLGKTLVRLPLGGAASNVPEAVREPKVLTFGLLTAMAGMGFPAFVLVRLLVW